MNRRIILFDGVCNLCNSSINFIIDHDKDNKFKFASLQSDAGRELLSKFGLNEKDFDSVVLTEGEKFYTRSSAVLRVVKEFGGLWKLLYVFIVIPPFIRNFFYDIVARYRYKWFGKKDSCRVPTPELKEKFL
ncbi:MAG: thiol-disulfide oxidoreductase DCC family protein [Ignavibacteria bacterium]